MTCPNAKQRACRRGFTLIELMVVMGIMAVLSAMIAVAVGNAQDAAKIAHTRAVIARIHTLLMDRWESYRWRRLPIQITPGSTPAQAAQLRCNAVRELMRMELPDRWTDITDAPVVQGMPQTATWTAYNAAYASYVAAYPNNNPPNPTYQGADCLYMIVTMGLEENDVLENFAQTDIGTDPNNPGMPCFIDAWGNPIQFLRWAPGFTSPLQPGTVVNGQWVIAPTDRDQTDPTGYYGSPPQNGAPVNAQSTFALYPLIYSGGPENDNDIVTGGSALRYSQTNPPNNPFVNVGTASAAGTDPGPVDEIHNQNIGVH
jgi:prepilin-type N-terminal cleavage/methylation domain-containing protein